MTNPRVKAPRANTFRSDRALADQAPEASAKLKTQRKTAEVRAYLGPADAAAVDVEAGLLGLERSAWVRALVRRRIRGAPTFTRVDELTLIAILAELRRIAVNISQFMRAMDAIATEAKPLTAERARLEEMRAEIRGHMRTLRKAFDGNLAYWDTPQ